MPQALATLKEDYTVPRRIGLSASNSHGELKVNGTEEKLEESPSGCMRFLNSCGRIWSLGLCGGPHLQMHSRVPNLISSILILIKKAVRRDGSYVFINVVLTKVL